MSTQTRRAAVATVALLALVTLAQATTLELTIDTEHAGPQVAFADFDGNPAKVFDVDGDGDQEIIAQNDNGWVYVLDSQTGAILAELDNAPSGFGARSFNGPEVAVMVDGGRVRLIAANAAAEVTSFRFDAEASTTDDMVFHEEWSRRLTHCESEPSMDAKPVLVDLDLDGRFEIVGVSEGVGVIALHDDGTTYWSACIGGGNAAPGIGDLNQDGRPDVISVSDTGVVAALDGRNGHWLWGFNARDHFDLRSASMPVSPGIGQLDGIGGPDIVVGARDSHDTQDYDQNHALLLALDSQGRILWSDQHPEANPLSYTRPVIVDTDDDGENEVYWGDWNTIGHKGGIPVEDSWAGTGPANFYRYTANGTLVWRQSLDTYWSNKDLALADVDDDGVQEVLANGPGCGGDGIWYLDSRTGAKEACISIHPWKASRGPIVADLDGDGGMKWVLEAQAATSEVSGGAVLVYDTGAPYDAAWPHMPYPEALERGNGTNQTGALEASFSTPGGNAWWVEVVVDASAPLAGVDARDDGGAWVPLEKRSWGAWARSFHVEDGSVLEFRARAVNGGEATSGGFTWPDGLPVGSGGPFEASFSTAGGNAWWVQVDVDANGPLAGVDARDDGGAWVPLEKQSWGPWTRSFHVADGSVLEFRARASSGDEVISGGHRWPDGTPTEAGDPGFQASFSTSGGNAWWVEVRVDANRALTSVEARHDGTWIALEARSWGAWAKSFHVPDGSLIAFRATTEGGEQAVSGDHAWPDGTPA